MDQVSTERAGIDLTDPRARDRVRMHTAPHVNDRIDRLMHADVYRSAERGREGIVARPAELDREWDIDRVVMANFAVVSLVTHELALRVHRVFRYAFRAQQAFLLLHALIGWCPPIALFRRLGFRTQKEIDAERAELVDRLRQAEARA